MASRQDHVLHAGSPGQLRPGICIELPCRETLGQRSVLVERNPFVVVDPLAASQQRVQTPMDEHSETCLVKPLHTLDVRWNAFSNHAVLLRSRCAILVLPTVLDR